MTNETFIELLKRNDPTEILEFIKRNGKKPKSVNPLIFEDEENAGNNGS